MDRRIIKTNELNIRDIPDPDAGWDQISDFALTFDPMPELGTTDIYKMSYMQFDANSSLVELRTTLFLFQRAVNHVGRDLPPEELKKCTNS